MEATSPPADHLDLTPRVLYAGDVARLLRRSVSTFYRKREQLEQRGFPLRSELLGGWHRDAVLAWIANHYGFAATATATDPWSLEASREKLKDVSFKPTRRRARQAPLSEDPPLDQ